MKRKIIFVLILIVGFLCFSCSYRMHWLDIIQSDITLLYDPNNLLTDEEKIINKEAGLITYVFNYEFPDNNEIQINILGDKCVKIENSNINSIQLIPISEGSCKLKIIAEDNSYGYDICNITVLKVKI